MSRQTFRYSKLESTTITYSMHEIIDILKEYTKKNKDLPEKMKFHTYDVDYGYEGCSNEICLVFKNEEEIKNV